MERDAYDEKLEHILRRSAAVFAEKGYHRASIRDVARAADVSLSGLYYYFSGKEELLYLIQAHCLEIILDRQQCDLAELEDPEQKLRVLVRNHLRFFVSNMAEMKVLSHEADSLTGEHRERVTAQMRAYTALAHDILEALSPGDAAADLRVATFSLFGMMNWIYTWYRPDRDVPVERLADEMLHLFLHGCRSGPIRETLRDDDVATDASLWTS